MTDRDLILWRDLVPAHHARFLGPLRAWMCLNTSMTARLRQTFGAQVRVEVLRDDPGRLRLDERRLLGPTARGRGGWVREVCLASGDTRLMAARTVYVSERLKRHADLTTLCAKPLGELLFAQGSSAMWTTREYAKVTPTSQLASLVRAGCDQSVRAHWARRTLYWLAGEALLVTEIFLSPMLRR